MVDLLLQLTCIGASITTKWYAYVFLRLLPMGERYLPIIFTSAAIYIFSIFLLQSDRKPKRGTLLKTVLALACGLPSSAVPKLSLLGTVPTLLAPILSADFVYRAHYLHNSVDLTFARIGWVTNSTAHVLLRAVSDDQLDLSYWPLCCDIVRIVHVPSPSASTDYTTTVQLADLRSGTEYEYNTTHGHHGTFVTRGTEDVSSFSILSTSCQKPGWPYHPLAHPLAIVGLSHLDQIVQSMGKRPEAMLFLGDFIYSDLPLSVSKYTTSYYRQLYRQVYSSPSWTPLLQSIPWLHMYDDHEIVNDFAPEAGLWSTFDNAIEPFRQYQQMLNPPPRNPTQPTYFSFNIGQVSFFVLDNRSFRSLQPSRPGPNSTAGHGRRTMLGREQLDHLKTWIEEEGDGRLLVLVSGVPFTRNWSEGKDELDSWAGYLDEREEILELLWGKGGAVVISGDRHEHGT